MRIPLVLSLLACALAAHARLPELIPYRKGNLWGYCDSTKKILIGPQWKEVGFFNGSTAKVSDGRAWGLIDRAGMLVAEIKYNTISDETVNGTRAATQSENGKQGAVNSRGAVVVPFEYEWLILSGNYLQGMKNNKTGFFNAEGKIVVPFIYDGRGDVPELDCPGLFAVKKHDDYGVVDSVGNTIIPFKYKWISSSPCGQIRAWGRDWDLVTYFDSYGHVVTGSDTCTGKAAIRLYQPFRNVFEEGSPYTWLDTNGHKPTTLRFMITDNFSNGMAAYQGFDSLYGYVNERFEIIFPSTFVFVNPFDRNGLARVWVRDPLCAQCKPLDGYVDTHGNKYWED